MFEYSTNLTFLQANLLQVNVKEDKKNADYFVIVRSDVQDIKFQELKPFNCRAISES